MKATPSDLHDLTERLVRLERKHRRLRALSGLLAVAVLLLAGWQVHRSLTAHMSPGLFTEGVVFWEDIEQRPSVMETVRWMTGRPPSPGRLVGGIGRAVHPDHAGVFFFGDDEQQAWLRTGQHGPYVHLKDSIAAIHLGTNLYTEGRTMLEFVSRDGTQALRLGLDARQEPVIEIVRNGEATSLLHP